MRAVKHVGCVMNDRRKHQVECGADESLYVHSEQRRNFQSKCFQESTGFMLLPPTPGTCGGSQLSSRHTEPLGLQVQGFCCPLQQRPCSGRVRPKVTLQSRGGGDGRLTVQCSLRSRLESGAKPAARSRTGTGPEMKPQGLAAAVSHCLDPASETAKSATTPCENKRQAGDGQPGATKVSELHLYLPSLICEDDKQDGEAEEMRTLVVETRV
ncbi:uncharacterized protein LOC111580775 isoform X2 [Amphiprion ocellaris]|uniref:uncharacterized protein LOC111580775 isoform X2 n=1 Tax=Amphiprion ocellaris TaxID=80972 RepID=UPI002410CE0C|nr:uncharacterized protein LOC111580775 isoform X2 [Amphiprion ocellaris]